MSTQSECPAARLALVIAAFTAVLVAAPATAQDAMPQPTQEQRDACKADFLRLCPGVRPGEGRPMQCLQSHAADLSPACGELVNAVIANQAAS